MDDLDFLWCTIPMMILGFGGMILAVRDRLAPKRFRDIFGGLLWGGIGLLLTIITVSEWLRSR